MRLIFQRDVDGASGDVYFMRLAGLSTETKPTENVATGSIFIEVDTDKKYRYDEDSTTWTEEPAAIDPEAISEAVEDWLDDHPEATTTVVDGAITYAKLDSSLKGSVDDVSDLKNAIDSLEGGTTGQILRKKSNTDLDVEWADNPNTEEIASAVDDWLDDHPEATTTVQDGSLTEAKFTATTLAALKNDYVTPEMFGAKGDGTTDDTQAINDAISYAMTNGVEVRFNPKTYGVIPATYKTGWNRNYRCAFAIEHSVVIDLNNAILKTLSHDVSYWSMFRVFNFNDRNGQIVIKNGKLIGDKENGATGDYYDSTQLISIKDSKNVIIDNMTLVNSKGDGIGISGQQYGDPYPSYPFEDFYMGIFVHNCIIDGSNRNGFSISKGRGIFIDNCVIKNTTGLNPKLGIDMEPVYGSGNVFDVTITKCIFENNTNGSVSGYAVSGITFNQCKADGGLFFRNCPYIKVYDSKFTYVVTYGSDLTADSCEITGMVTIEMFTVLYDHAPKVLVSNTTVKGIEAVASNGETAFEKICFDNCTFRTDGIIIDTHLIPQNRIADIFIVQNSTFIGTGEDNPGAQIFDLHKTATKVILKNNDIRIGGKGSPYGLIGRFRSSPKSFQFSGNRVFFDGINSGQSRATKGLFYGYEPSEDSDFIIDNNIINIEGETLNTNGDAIAVINGSTAYAKIYARNNFLRGIERIDRDNTATILENRNNLFGNVPGDWNGDMSIFSGGLYGQFLTKKSNSNYDFAWVTVPQGNGVSF